MSECKSCGKKISFLKVYKIKTDSYCSDCAEIEYQKLNHQLDVELGLVQERNEESQKIIMSSLLQIPEKKIAQCFDLISNEVVMRIGVISEFETIGNRATGFEKKLKEAKETAIYNLKVQAYELGANAILGSDIDYMEIGDNMFMVTVSGTPVVFQKNELQGSE